MTFVQTIEFDGDKDEFERLLARYIELMGADTTAKRAWLFEDRERPGRFVEMVEFDSYELAQANSDHPGTQAWVAEASSILGQATFRNLDLVAQYDI